MENNEVETLGKAQEQREEKPNETEKKFTQADVDRIVKERLGRIKVSEEVVRENAAMTAELKRRENILDCKAYLLENEYPRELLDVVSAENVEEFKNKVDKIYSIFQMDVPPLGSTEMLYSETDIKTAFDRGVKHKPKEF